MDSASTVRLLIVEDMDDDAALVAHWLRKGGLSVTYRGVIKGCAELALADLPADHPCRPDIATIEQVADQAAALTRQLLIFSRLQPAQPETLDANAVIRQTAQLLRRAPRWRGAS
jgi:signal transduction histidine kinase